jgi:alpha-galactosidase
VLRHVGDGPPISIRGTVACWFGIHEAIEHVVHLSGSWAAETEVRREQLLRHPLTLESRVGKTSFGSQPYAALLAGATTYLCQIFWSGNWVLQVSPTASGAAVSGGLNNWQFRHRLLPGASLTLPVVLFGRFDGDLDDGTRRLHDYRRSIRPDPNRSIPVQFNSWYPHRGEPTAETMLALIPKAKRLGCEVFVIDAGWYRTDDADTDDDWDARTGDWRTSHRRFPQGLGEISQRCRDEGLRFGLWFEPEVLGRLAAVRRAHPEWLHYLEGRAPAPEDRTVLNLGVPAAKQYVFDRVGEIIDRIGVDWLKWDFNVDLDDGGWAPGLPAQLIAQDPIVAHYLGLYDLMDKIRQTFPDLILEMCAGGGGRMDGEILSHAHVNWISDQPSPLRKLAIHFGSQLAHPAVDCNDWLVEWPPGAIAGYDDDAPQIADLGDLPFRFRVAMLGSFGISASINQWSQADFETGIKHVALYAGRLRPIIHHGDQYMLTAGPRLGEEGDWAAIWYVAKHASEGALFAFRLGSRDATREFRLPGLAPERLYRATLGDGSQVEAMGGALAAGLKVHIPQRFRSDLCLIELA